MKILFVDIFLFITIAVWGQPKDCFTREYITPNKIVWTSDNNGVQIKRAESLLAPGNGQAILANRPLCVLENKNGRKASILLDFNKELHGGIQIVTGLSNPRRINVRIRFGESVTEAMAELGEKGSTTDHAMRDLTVELPWLGSIELGNTGFRFVRIDLLSEEATLHLKEVRAISIYRDIAYRGSFTCNDDKLNAIWKTGAYTVHLNMQDYLWDGIKRDRLIWLGDMHPEVMTINTVFGYNNVVPKSLDLIRDETPLPKWMNGFSSYSIWWLIIHYDWYMYQGNLEYLKGQKSYIINLIKQLIKKVDKDGKEKLDGMRFLDWPSSRDPKAIKAGLQSLMVMALETGSKIAQLLGESDLAEQCVKTSALMKKCNVDHNHSKQAAALMSLAGLADAKQMNTEVLSVDGAKRFSTFYGYYMLEAMAAAGDYEGAMDIIRTYWGGMIELGATTFWEDFDIEWLNNAARIDELPTEGKVDVHATYGGYCYTGFRHSFCHGWASGPTAWLSRHVLGIEPIEPGCKVVRIVPHLGNLLWAEGTFPTPEGDIYVRHERTKGGNVKTKIKAPRKIKIVEN